LEMKDAIAAMDVETFGEHHREYHKFLEKMLTLFPTCTASEVIEHKSSSFSEIPLTSLKSCSWSTEIDDLKKNIPFPLWDDPGNGIHQLQLTHLYTLHEALKLVDNTSDGFENAHILVSKAMQSCQFWWANRGHWEPEIIRKALILQIQGLKSLQDHISERDSRVKYESLIKLSNWINKRLTHGLESLERNR
ncbi:MAG: hypothetical protein ACFFBD_04050, partial [Candidatus Hodarchaeota archaeon]